MARKSKGFDQAGVIEYRKALGLNQQQFWTMIGVTQSGGSRYESGRQIPRPAAALLWLHQVEKITDQDLAAAMKAVKGK